MLEPRANRLKTQTSKSATHAPGPCLLTARLLREDLRPAPRRLVEAQVGRDLLHDRGRHRAAHVHQPPVRRQQVRAD
eukprot:scaffold12147_cov64-Phaeocystis_antarctica.AAC.1